MSSITRRLRLDRALTLLEGKLPTAGRRSAVVSLGSTLELAARHWVVVGSPEVCSCMGCLMVENALAELHC